MYDPIETTALTLGSKAQDGTFIPVVTLALSGNNETPQRQGRLHFGFKGSYPSEIEIEPGPDCHPRGNLVGQIMQWGPTTPDGRGRARLTSTIVADGDGGLAAVVDSTTNDGTGRVMPLVVNAGEGQAYVIFHPSDDSLELQDRKSGKSIRLPVREIIEALRSR